MTTTTLCATAINIIPITMPITIHHPPTHNNTPKQSEHLAARARN
jgi:hypothetical protein